MINRFLLPCAAALVLSAGACVFHLGGNGDADWRPARSTLEKSRRHNRTALEQLEIGMSVDEVRERMGSGSTWGGDAVGWIDNPYRTESFRAGDGSPVRILFYYTETVRHDDAITDDELTPVAFQDGALVGWGWSYFRRAIKEL